MGPPPAAFELRVELADVEPPVWRTVLVPADIRLHVLHQVLQASFGWTDSHLHHFFTGNTRTGRTYYGMPDPEGWGTPEEDERKFSLKNLAPGKGFRLSYEYDFGDSWLHELEVVREVEGDGEARRPRCTGGSGACPPEDIGGAWGYADFLEALRDPKHEEHEDAVEWVGEDFDPEAFDVGEANEAIEAAVAEIAARERAGARRRPRRKGPRRR